MKALKNMKLMIMKALMGVMLERNEEDLGYRQDYRYSCDD